MNRVGTLGGALAVAGVLLGGCGQQSSTGAPESTGSAPASAPAASHLVSPSSQPATPAMPAARVIALTVRGGQVSGETGRVEVPLGTPVTITVTSDIADEVHVHGYDKEAEIPAGGTGSVSFTADIPGVFEAELHESGKQLLQLQVS